MTSKSDPLNFMYLSLYFVCLSRITFHFQSSEETSEMHFFKVCLKEKSEFDVFMSMSEIDSSDFLSISLKC